MKKCRCNPRLFIRQEVSLFLCDPARVRTSFFPFSNLFCDVNIALPVCSSMLLPLTPPPFFSIPPIQSKHMTSCYWGSSSSAAERHDPSLPYLEQYRIDPLQFRQLFVSLAPWVCGGHNPTLSARLFRLLDQNQDGLVNFKEFITGLSEPRLQPQITYYICRS